MKNEITLNGIIYVPKSELKTKINTTGMKYCIVRTYSAGVFAGDIDTKKIENKKGTVLNARRLWQWQGAASLSQLAMEGTKKPNECKFPCEVDVELTEIIEVIPCTEEAKTSIASVPIWKI